MQCRSLPIPVPAARTCRLGAIGCALLALGCGGGAAGERSPAPGPESASDADLVLEELDGSPLAPLQPDGARATVFLFVRTDCPISNRYAPEARRLHREYAPRGVAFWLVYPGTDELPETIRRHREEFGYPFPALRDPEHQLVRRSGARVTPEAALFTGEGELVYSGRIDDRYVAFGKARAAPTVRDLADALEATLAGEPPEVARSPAIGCSIPPPS